MNIRINSKNYVVPQLGFKHMTKMEDMGFSVPDLFQKQKVFSIATAFVGVVAIAAVMMRKILSSSISSEEEKSKIFTKLSMRQ